MCSMWLKLIQFSIIYLFTLQNVVSELKLIYNQLSKLPGPLEPGMAIQIIGRPWYIRGAFHFDLQEGTDEPEGDIGFHLSVRHKQDKIVFNTMRNGNWDDEEVYPDRFDGYEDYNVTRIAARDAYHFQIYFHKKEYIFRYRMPTENLKFLFIGGNYTAESIIWERKNEEGQFEKIENAVLINKRNYNYF